MTCFEYQIIAEQAPNISDEDRRAAIMHLGTDDPCDDCRDRQTAFRAVQNRRLAELAARGM